MHVGFVKTFKTRQYLKEYGRKEYHPFPMFFSCLYWKTNLCANIVYRRNYLSTTLCLKHEYTWVIYGDYVVLRLECTRLIRVDCNVLQSWMHREWYQYVFQFAHTWTERLNTLHSWQNFILLSMLLILWLFLKSSNNSSCFWTWKTICLNHALRTLYTVWVVTSLATASLLSSDNVLI
jgi:hypothetical protein